LTTKVKDGTMLAIYLTSIIKPSFYYPCVAVGKFLAVAGFLAGRDCQILQIETQKRNALIRERLFLF
jgi:hypothetical protein